MSRISLPTIKQVNSGANLLQKVQHLLLFGDVEPALVTQDLFVKEDFIVRRCTDNARRLINYSDAAEGEQACSHLNFELHPVHMTEASWLFL